MNHYDELGIQEAYAVVCGQHSSHVVEYYAFKSLQLELFLRLIHRVIPTI